MARLFGTDGIRGVAGRWPLTPEFVRRIGYAAGSVLAHRGSGRRSLLAVRDTRGSGPALLRSLSEGFTRAGFSVADGGVLPTPSVAFLVPRQRFSAGAVISASHNPAEFNGIKFFGPGGTKLSDEVENRIENAVRDTSFLNGNGTGRHLTRQRRAFKSYRFYNRAASDYLRFLESLWPKGLSLRGVRLVLDCANGATHAVAAQLFSSLGANVSRLSSRPNGRNINDRCGALFPQTLVKMVQRRGFDLGVAFDGDGDRAIFVDETGVKRDGDAVLLAAARDWKRRGRLKNNLVVLTVMSNLGLRRALDHLGIDVIETPVGDRYVWEAMKKQGAVIGGEASGHMIFGEHLPTGDGLVTALQMLRIMLSSGQPFSALTSLFVLYPQILKNVRVREKKSLESLPTVDRAIQTARARLGKTGRVLVRYSGTEPLLRVMAEGADPMAVRDGVRVIVRAVRQAGL